ncbi:MAG: DUF7576 family protein [Candidatus Helarchaeota archaeon]
MSTPKKHLQKWKRKEKQEREAASVSIYPHFHCLVCDKMIEKGESYKSILRKTDRSISYQDFCSKECYEKYVGKPGKKRSRWMIVFYISVIVAIVVIITLLIIFGFI